MSYDLYIKPAASDDPEFLDMLFQLRGYKVDEHQAYYENPDTGIYFYFDYRDLQEESSFAFNLNYVRPSIFALEAAAELDAIITALKAEIEDPQSDGMGEGPFSRQGFLRGWNAGNRFAYQVILQRSPDEELLLYPAADMLDNWQWNYQRGNQQEQAGDAQFVPPLMLIDHQGEVKSATVWPDACLIRLPKSDFVLFMRLDLSTTPEAEDPREMFLLPWDTITHLLEGIPEPSDATPYYDMTDEQSAEIETFVRSLPETYRVDSLERLAPDSVHDRELVEELRAKRG